MTQRISKVFQAGAASAVALVAALPTPTYAQPAEGGGDITTLMENIITFIDARLIPFILGIGFLFFVWGMFRYFIVGAASEESRDKGKNVLIYSAIAFVVIIVFWGVINMLVSSLGWGGQTLQYIPTIIVPTAE